MGSEFAEKSSGSTSSHPSASAGKLHNRNPSTANNSPALATFPPKMSPPLRIDPYANGNGETEGLLSYGGGDRSGSSTGTAGAGVGNLYQIVKNARRRVKAVMILVGLCTVFLRSVLTLSLPLSLSLSWICSVEVKFAEKLTCDFGFVLFFLSTHLFLPLNSSNPV